MSTSTLSHRAAALALFGMLLVGCSNSAPLPPPTDLGDEGGADSNFALDAKFLDEVKSNREDDGSVSDLEFVDAEGNSVKLQQYKEEKNVLLVFTRGFSGQLCPYCTTQTSRLIANYDKFTALDTEVLLVYPGSKAQLPMFMQASIETSGKNSFPFPVLLDEDLAAVNQLGISAQLAFPSTFIVDKQGQVRLSYVGSDPTDRPSIKALLAQLGDLQD
jgi:peroxiredoxin